jgi:tetratricopeptide (TPR) repeat protein
MPGRADLEGLLMYARARQHDDPAGSLELFENVAELAASAGERLLKADALLGCGECIGLIDGREGESLPYFRRAAELAPGTIIAALSWLAAGDMLRFRGDTDPAAEAYSQAVTLFEGLQDAFGECLARKALADLLVSQGRTEEAVVHLVCASSLALETGEPQMAAELQLTLGEQLSGLRRHSEAASPLRSAAELFRMTGNGRLEARARIALLNALHAAHPGYGTAQQEQMVRLAELSVANAGSENDAEAEIAARFMLSALAGDRDEHEAGVTGGRAGAGWQGSQLGGESATAERAASEARARLELATQLQRLGRGGAGFEQFRRAAELYETAGQAAWAGRALLGCASSLIAGERAQQSVEWFSRAAEQFEACGDKPGLAQAEAGRLQAQADLQQWDEIERSQKVLTITDGDQTQQARAARLIALTYQAQALAAGRDHDGAANAAIQAASLASELGERELEARLRLAAGHSLRILERFPDAAAAYELAITVITALPDPADWEAAALKGLGAVLRDSPQTGAERLRRLAERYTSAGDERMEAICRYELALCVERIRPAQHAECAREYVRAAQLFDQAGDIGRAGDCWYRAAQAYNWLGLLHPEYREMCYEACGTAAGRFAEAGNMAGKGVAEFMAGQALRKDDPAAAPDPRSLPVLRDSVRSFARAGWAAAETGSRLAVTIELTQVGTDDEWMASALPALRSYEAARGSLLMPQQRQRNDKQVSYGLMFLTQYLRRAWPGKGGTPQWKELAWRLEQAAKGRSFLDQHRQDEVWNSLVASDRILRDLTGRIEHLILRRDELTRRIDAALLAEQISDKIRAQAEERNTISSDLENAQRQLDRRVEDVIRERPDQAALASVPPVTPAGLQACLHPGEAYLGYLWNGGSPIRSLVTSGMVRIQPADGSWAEYVRQAVAAARDGQTPPDISPQDAAGLLGHIPDGTDALIISPDGLLNGFPWHLVPLSGSGDAGQPLGERYATAVIPAAGLLPRLRASHDANSARRPTTAYLGVACDGAAAGAPLACVDAEVQAVARDYFAADPQSGFLTTADCHRLLEHGCSVRLLHLACHADRNGLLLSRDGTWITPVDLVNRRLRAHILLLTGCHAGDFAGHDSNEFLGVVRQLIIATRSRAAIVSAAPIPDHAAPVFADLVVSALTGHNHGRPWPVPAEPLAVGPAVAWARRSLRERSRKDVTPLIPEPDAFPRPWDPRWWSPWFVVGDPNATIDD